MSTEIIEINNRMILIMDANDFIRNSNIEDSVNKEAVALLIFDHLSEIYGCGQEAITPFDEHGTRLGLFKGT